MNGQIQATKTKNEVATLLIPMNGKQLVLPNVTVAEVIPFTEPTPVEDAPPWYLGTFQWRNLDIPLVSYEVLNGESGVTQNRSRRIAVLNGVVDNQNLPFCAMVTEGMPRLMRVMADEISADEEAEPGPCDVGRVIVNGERAVIPNVDFLQQQVLTVSQ